MRCSRGISSQRRITGSDRSCSYPTALRLAVPSRKYVPVPASSPSQRAANTRRKCPLEKTSTSPPIARTRRTTRSARAPTWSGAPPPGHRRSKRESRSSSRRGTITTDLKLPGKVEGIGSIVESSTRIAVFEHKLADLGRTLDLECRQEPLAGFELHPLDAIGPMQGANTARKDRRDEDGGGDEIDLRLEETEH